MKQVKLTFVLLVGLTLGIWACSSDNNGGGGGGAGDSCTSSSCTCETLCTDASYDSGTETDFGGGLVECQCEGSGDELEKSSCETYCDQFDVSPADSLLSSETNPNDKCVCDGTS
jgi:hypothetical protein